MCEDAKRIKSREFTAEVVDSLIDDRERLIDYAHETNKQADEYLELALLRQHERDKALKRLSEWRRRAAELEGRAVEHLFLAEKVDHEREQARAVARRLYNDWDARTVRSLQEIAEENPWILEK